MVQQENKQPYFFIAFAAIFFIAIFIIENINHRFWLNDFKVYYSAAKAFLNGEKIYGVPFGLDTGYYKYSPFVLLLFTPDCLLPYNVAAIFHFVVIAASAIACIILANKIISTYVFRAKSEKENLLMSAALLCIAVHIIRELHLGNVNIIILLLLTCSLWFMLEQKYAPSGIFLGIAVLLKPYFLILLVPVVVFRKWKTVLSFVFTLIVSEIICTLAFGYTRNIALHREWFDAAYAHGTYLQSNHTFQSLIKNYFNIQIIASTVITGFAAVLFTVLLIIILSRRKNKNDDSLVNRNLVSGYFCSIAVVPNLVITDTEHFLLSLPLIMMLIDYVQRQRNKFSTGIFILLILFYGANSTDLLGKTLSQQFDSMGLLGISNLLIIFFALYLFLFRHETIKLNER